MNLFHFFGQLEDPRKDINQKYPFLEIIFLTMSAVVSGAEGWTKIKQFGDYHLAWLRKYLPFKQGIPVDDTIARVVRRLSPIQLNDIFINFVNEIRAAQGLTVKPCATVLKVAPNRRSTALRFGVKPEDWCWRSINHRVGKMSSKVCWRFWIH